MPPDFPWAPLPASWLYSPPNPSAADPKLLPRRKRRASSPQLTLHPACSTLSGFASTPHPICLQGSRAWLLDDTVSRLLSHCISHARQLAFCNRRDVICHGRTSLPTPAPSERVTQTLDARIIINICVIWSSAHILASFSWFIVPTSHIPLLCVWRIYRHMFIHEISESTRRYLCNRLPFLSWELSYLASNKRQKAAVALRCHWACYVNMDFKLSRNKYDCCCSSSSCSLSSSRSIRRVWSQQLMHEILEEVEIREKTCVCVCRFVFQKFCQVLL